MNISERVAKDIAGDAWSSFDEREKHARRTSVKITLEAAGVRELVDALEECEEAMELHMNMYPAMAKGYTIDAVNSARTALSRYRGEA